MRTAVRWYVSMTPLTRLLAAALCLVCILSSSSAGDTEFCSLEQAGDNCGQNQEETASFSSTVTPRYILYDVNPPEGFNLRRDVYMRLAIFVKNLNKKQGNWKLVLPPWGRLYHWQSSNVGEQLRLQWKMFFDTPSLQKFAPVIEMDEFYGKVKKGRPTIDEVYVLQHYKDMWDEGKEWKDRWDVEKCVDSIPYTKSGKLYKGPFWHYDNITAQKVECASFQGHASLLSSLLNASNGKSVMIDHAEVALHDHYGDRTYWEARRSMRFAKHLVQIADEFRKEHLHSSDEEDGISRPNDWQEETPQKVTGGGPYVAVHLRRKDFLWGRSRQVPDLQYAATQLEKILKKLGLHTVFVASDAPKPEFAELKTYLSQHSRYKVLRFEPSPSMKYTIKDGGVAIVDQIICSHAKYFIGTHESTFSFRIQEEREIMGFLPNTTFNRLCGKEEGEPCDQPTQWQIVF